MTKTKSTTAATAAPAVGSNWAALQFPTDIDGLTPDLRQAFREVVLRCRGSEQKFHLVKDTLDILMAWAQAKLADDRAENAARIEAAAAQDELAARQEAFRVRVQAGPVIQVEATATGFVEIIPHNGSAGAVYDCAEDARGPVAAMACMMLAEGRNPASVLKIGAFGRPGIGSGQTLGQLARTAPTGTPDSPAPAPDGLIAIQV